MTPESQQQLRTETSMRLTMLSTAVCAGAVALGWQSAVLASSVHPTLSVSGTFQDIDVDANTDYNTFEPGNHRALLVWQDKEEDKEDDSISLLGFDGFNHKKLDEYDGSPFALAKLNFYNGTGPGAPGLNSAGLSVSVQLDGQANSFDWTFKLALEEFQGRRKPGDSVNITGDLTSYTFKTDSGSYIFKLLGWSDNGGETFTDTLKVGDEDFGRLKLYGSVTAVPVPPAVWLLGSGLLGLVGVARRRNS